MIGATTRQASATRRGRHARRWITVAVIVVAIASGGATAWAITARSGPGYRTATVARADITQTLLSTGTIEPVSQANVSFPVAGQVASVSVGPGSRVRAGQVIARLSRTALASAVSAGQSEVAAATVRLAADQASQTTAAARGGGGGGIPSSIARELAAITRQQAAVRAARHRIDANLTAAKALLATETALCAAIPTPTPTPTPSPTGSVPAPAPSPSACQAAITRVLSGETSIAAAEQSLADSESALGTALSKVTAAVTKAAGSGSRGATTRAPATAAQLAADQASLDAANARLSVARQDLGAATLVAPIAGTVALVNIAPGQQVTGGQGSGSTADFVIAGAGGQEAITTVSVPDVGKLRVGQPATVTVDGSDTSISGAVVAIGVLASTSSAGNASYPVTIGLAADAPTLFAGAGATVAITLATVNDAITVPTSAVHGTGAATFVTVLKAGKPVRVRVAVGATSPVRTAISAGLSVGEHVILADMSTPLPANTNPFAQTPRSVRDK